MEITLLFVVMLALIIVGVPIGYSIGVSTLLTLIIFTEIPLVMVAQNAFRGIDSFPLMAIPFFILAGNLMTQGGLARRIVSMANVFAGRSTGGLASVATLGCMFFGAISGSAIATTSAMATMVLPEMEAKNYDKNFSASLVAAAGTVGIILPPSIPFVVYGVVTNTSIGRLFIAGIIPGILMGAALLVAGNIISRRRGYVGDDTPFTVARAFKELRGGIWAILAPIIILGGIYGGIFTPTEAAVVSVVYALLVGVVIYRELTWAKIRLSLYNTLIINGITTFMIGLSTVFSAYLSLNQIPQRLASFFLGITENPILLLLLINVLLFIIGFIVDNIPACIILAPILLPVVINLGMSPVQFGVVLTLNLAIGFVTPPYGTNLFVTAAIAKIPVAPLFKTVLPFILALFIVLMIVTYFPPTTMFLVELMN